MKTIIGTLALAALVLAGCAKQAETSTAVGREFTVEKLFTYEGCTVHRFSDAGYYRYFTKCGAASSVFWNETHACGKSCTRHVAYEVPTAYQER